MDKAALADLLTSQLNEICADSTCACGRCRPGRQARGPSGRSAQLLHYLVEQLEGNVSYRDLRGVVDPEGRRPGHCGGGAQLRLKDVNGMRVTAFATNTPRMSRSRTSLPEMGAETPTIVLVHGAWADATGFDAEIRALRDLSRNASGAT